MATIFQPDSAVSGFQPQTTQQAAAIAALVEFATGEHGARVMTLQGYAGTGKTVLVGELTRRLAPKFRIAIAAPTHKAVGVLREKVGAVSKVEFTTLHSLLGLRLQKSANGTYRCTPEGMPSIGDYDLVVIDECSMIAADLFAMTIAPAFRSTRILFVGDPAQLPPVEDRNALSPTFSRVQHKAVLTDVCRQAAGHPAIQLSMRIRNAIESGYRLDAQTLRPLCAVENSDVLFATGGNVTAFNWALHDIRAGNDTRILAWRNETVRRYNRDIHAALHGEAMPFAVGETVVMNDSHDAREVSPGDPLRARKLRLHNSEECQVFDIRREPHPRHDITAWRLSVQRDNGECAVLWIADDENARQARISAMFTQAAKLKRSTNYTTDAQVKQQSADLIRAAWALREDIADARHAYSMTVHKSQGSTLDTAIVDLADIQRNLDDEYNRMLYVAATRPREHLAFVA